MIDIRTIIPYARNSRRHSESQIAKLVAVIDEFGFTSPLITVGNELKAGHGRLEAVQRILSGGGHIYPAPGRKNGAEPFTDWFLPNIDATGWSDNQARAYVIAENRMAELADWDNELLALELEDLRLADFDLNLTGFDSAALDSIMDDADNKNENAGEDTEPQNDRAKELREKYGVEAGQVWQLGKHRLACGDCTDIEVVKRAMGGDKANACITDPPYGIGSTNSDKNNYDSYEDTIEHLQGLINGFLPIAINFSSTVVITPGNQNQRLYPHPTWTMAWFTPAGSGSGPWGFCCWQPILCYGKDPKLATGKGRHPDAIVHTERSEDLAHPCPKPIRFWEWLVTRVSNP